MQLPATTHAPIVDPASIETLLIQGGINVVAAILILLVGWVLSKKVDQWIRASLGRVRHFDATLRPLLASLARYAIILIAVIAVLERFGVETTSLVTLLGATGLAVGLALQGALSNVAAGVMLLVLRPFRVGDNITVTASSQSGIVREIGLFTTILISPDEAYISIPNSAIFSSVIVNSSREPLARLNFTVAIDTANDVDAALKLVTDILKADPRVLENPPPVAAVAALKEYSVELLVRCWVKNGQREIVSFDLQKTIRKRFRRSHIAAPVPRQTTVTTHDDDAPVQQPALRKSG